MFVNKIKITDEDIKYSENILLPKKSKFNNERIEFIKNLETIDLQAVPGSGKTTSLLAKLLILENYLPFEDGSGVLVISHTNRAVNEIKDRIGQYCPKIFSYPNFVGTIQGFVDQFLAIPFYKSRFKKSLYRVNSDLYDEEIKEFIKKPFFPKFNLDDNNFKKIQYIAKANEKFFYDFRFFINSIGKEILIESIEKEDKLEIKKPKGRTKKENYKDYSDNEKNLLYNWFFDFKNNFLEKGILHFDDAYFLANQYINEFPEIVKILQKRFKFIFVDEVQDMDKHQYNLLENLFYDNKESSSIYQRIGDLNQAIHSNISFDDSWKLRDVKLEITGSHRLSSEVADVVKFFGVKPQKLEGLNKSYQHKPHIIIFNDPKDVLPKFTEIIKNKGLRDIDNLFYAIGWREKHEKDDRLGIRDYHPTFNNKEWKNDVSFDNLDDYIKFNNKENGLLRHINKNILDIFVRILRLEGVKNEENRNYKKGSFLNKIKDSNRKEYERFKVKIFNWSFQIFKGENIKEDIKKYIPIFLDSTKDIFQIDSLSESSKKFIDSTEVSKEIKRTTILSDDCNTHKSNGVEIKVGTIHSVKGMTHSATLYMENFYFKYELDHLTQQFIKEKINSDIKKRAAKAAKMVYVGFSRPKDLLCFAVHKDRFNDKIKEGMKDWEVINITKDEA
ncbi:MAG: UvrD-helicase domain-containing protein [Candidatus Paceibacterota bacterium]